KVVDTDGDEVLTAEEHAVGSRAMFKKMDTDKDGFLTKDEFAAGHARMMKKPSRSASEAVSPAVVQFLLAAAATDFHTHRPPDPVRFRDVRIGRVMTPGGEEQYMLCGQFLPAQEGG